MSAPALVLALRHPDGELHHVRAPRGVLSVILSGRGSVLWDALGACSEMRLNPRPGSAC